MIQVFQLFFYSISPYCFFYLPFICVFFSLIDAPCGAPAWTGNGLLNSNDDLTTPCVKNQESDDASVDVKAENNGMFHLRI